MDWQLSDLNRSDRLKLWEAKEARLRGQFPLNDATLMCSLQGVMHIVCDSEAQSNALQAAHRVLQVQVWRVFGCHKLSIWWNSEVAWRSSTPVELVVVSDSEIESTIGIPSDSEEYMATSAVAERPTMNGATTEQQRDIATIAQEVAALAGVEAANKVIDDWANKLKSSLQPQRKAAAVAAAPAPAPTATATAPTKAKKATAKPSSDKAPASSSKPNLRLPSANAMQLSRDYSKTLKNVLPKGNEERQSYLEAIVSGSEHGRSYINRLAKAMATRFKGKMLATTAENGLMQAAAGLMTGGSDEQSAQDEAPQQSAPIEAETPSEQPVNS